MRFTMYFYYDIIYYIIKQYKILLLPSTKKKEANSINTMCLSKNKTTKKTRIRILEKGYFMLKLPG